MLLDHRAILPQTSSVMSQWYYAANGEQAGPVEETELKQLSEKGTITPETLVWKEGMADWKPYSEVFSAAVTSASASSAPATTGAEPASTTAVSSAAGFGAPTSGTKASELGLKYDFGDFLCWGGLPSPWSLASVSSATLR